MNVLVFPCASEIGAEVYRALNGKKNVTLFGLGGAIEDFTYENYFGGCPYVTDKEFIPHVQDIIKDENIDVIYPANDVALLYLKRNEHKLCRVIGPSLAIVEACNQKFSTYKLLQPAIRTPKMYTLEDAEFPCFLKPNVGHSGIGCKKIDSRLELAVEMKKDKRLLILEYLPGDEYTVDCFSNRFFSPRVRRRIGNGIALKTEVVTNKLERANLYAMWRTIYDEIVFDGERMDCAWFFQVKKTADGEFCLMEVAARIGGSSGLTRLRNINLPLLNLMAQWPKVEIAEKNYVESVSRSLDVKCKLNIDFKNVYVDFDDTLNVNGDLNYKLLALLYKWRHQGKSIYILTRALESQVGMILHAWSVDLQLFDNIISVPRDKKKSEMMYPESILIDDSFMERRDCDHPSFDIDIVDSLL
jgi:hypothetical protein